MKSVFHSLEILKATLDQHRPLDPAIVANLREDLIVRWTYHSNAIEGNTLRILCRARSRPRPRQSRAVPRAHRGHREREFPPVFPCLEPAMGGGIMSFFGQPIPDVEGAFYSQIPRIRACGIRTMCERTPNRPATPLHDAHQGGCFMYSGRREGGRP